MTIRVYTSSPEGNVFNIMGLVRQLLSAQGRTSDDIKNVLKDMSSGNYRHALDVANRETFDSFEFIGLEAEDTSA